MEQAKTVLDIKGLTVRLPKDSDRENAIEDVSFSVNAGEIVCVVGESGSGKSVTAQTVMGLNPPGQLTPSAGSILLNGDEILNIPQPCCANCAVNAWR